MTERADENCGPTESIHPGCQPAQPQAEPQLGKGRFERAGQPGEGLKFPVCHLQGPRDHRGLTGCAASRRGPACQISRAELLSKMRGSETPHSDNANRSPSFLAPWRPCVALTRNASSPGGMIPWLLWCHALTDARNQETDRTQGRLALRYLLREAPRSAATSS